LLGDPSRSKTILGWEPEYDLEKLCADMITSDLELMKKDAYLTKGGYTISKGLE
jgi:GDPmannose 4,6-dehydratase